MDTIFAVIDLGTSQIRGMVAKKGSDGRLSPIAHCTEASKKNIRRGAVHNIDETANIIDRIVQRLNAQLEKHQVIKALYVGISSQSLSSKEYIISQELAPEGEVVNQDHIDKLWEEIRAVDQSPNEILDISEPIYYLDGKTETLAKGLFCNKIEARFQLITARPSVSRNIRIAVEDRLNLRLAGILITPIWEANACLSEDAINIGCAYINIGAGTSSVSIYKNGLLMRFNVLPFGGYNITRDLTSFHISEQEAEALKFDLVNLTPDKNAEETSYKIYSDDGTSKELRISEVNHIAQKRMEEIVANLLNVINLSGYIDSIKAGLYINGGGSKIRNFKRWLNKNSIKVQKTQINKQHLDEDNPVTYSDDLQSLLALCLGATENCIEHQTQELETLFTDHDTAPVEDKEPVVKRPQQATGRRKGSWLTDIFTSGKEEVAEDDDYMQHFEDEEEDEEDYEEESTKQTSNPSGQHESGIRRALRTFGNFFDNETNVNE